MSEDRFRIDFKKASKYPILVDCETDKKWFIHDTMHNAVSLCVFINRVINDKKELQRQNEQLNLAIDDLLSHVSCEELVKENEELKQVLRNSIDKIDMTYSYQHSNAIYSVRVVVDQIMYSKIKELCF